MRLMAAPGAVERFYAEDDATQKAFLIRMAHQVASDEQVDYDRFSGNSLYDSGFVRGMLDRQGWHYTIDIWNPEVSDLAEGLESLKRKDSTYWACIVNRFEREEIPSAENKNEQRRIRRAVVALTREMNLAGRNRQRRRIEGPGTRRVVSNSSARTLTWDSA